MAKTLADVHVEFERAFNAGDAEGLLALYQEDAMMAVQPGQYVTGLTAIAAGLAPFLSSGMKMKLSTIFAMEHGDLALLGGAWVLSGGPEELTGRTSEVLRRGADGHWRYAIDNPWSA